MRVNRSKLRKVSNRRAHRPDSQVYRSMRRLMPTSKSKILWIELFIAAALIGAVVWLMIRWFK